MKTHGKLTIKLFSIIFLSLMILSLILPFHSSAQIQADKVIKKVQKNKLAMFIPRQKPFWLTNAQYAKAAANSLGLELEVIDFRDDSTFLLKEVERICQEGVDGIIFSAFQSTGEAILKITENYLLIYKLKKLINFF